MARMLDMPCRIEYFKMNEASCAPAAPKKQFAGWLRERTDERVAIAYGVAEKPRSTFHFKYRALWIWMPFTESSRSPVSERNAINPFYLAFSRIVSGFAIWQTDLGLHDKVDFIFDDRVMEKKKIRDAWDSFKENAAAEARPYIGSDPRFEDDKEFLPLQAADLIAWWVRKMATEKRQIATFPWKPSREIPGFQFHCDEKVQLKVRENIIAKLRA
jgi:hypothetical protein